MADVTVGLSDAIEALRDELVEVMRRGADKPIQFNLDPIEMTVQVVVTKDANGKIGWHIIEFGGSIDNVRTQTLTVRLSPLWRKEDGTLTSDFSVAAPGPSGEIFGSHA